MSPGLARPGAPACLVGTGLWGYIPRGTRSQAQAHAEMPPGRTGLGQRTRRARNRWGRRLRRSWDTWAGPRGGHHTGATCVLSRLTTGPSRPAPPDRPRSSPETTVQGCGHHQTWGMRRSEGAPGCVTPRPGTAHPTWALGVRGEGLGARGQSQPAGSPSAWQLAGGGPACWPGHCPLDVLYPCSQCPGPGHPLSPTHCPPLTTRELHSPGGWPGGSPWPCKVPRVSAVPRPPSGSGEWALALPRAALGSRPLDVGLNNG